MVVTLLLYKIFNAIIEFGMIPSVLKIGVTIPVYKGGGKDPLDVQSYRGISLNSVIFKILERLILDRLEPVYSGGGIPHPNQSAYRKEISCGDAIFATLETLIRFLQEKCSVYMCLYDLQKAFDSVEVPVLLQGLFDVGVCSKTWRILQSWFTDCCSVVRLGSQSSSPFTVQRGVRQGSILSPSPLPLPFSDGSPFETASIIFPWPVYSQHLRWWISTCG